MKKDALVSLYKPAEIDLLTKDFRLAVNPSPDRGLSVPAADLLDKAKCLDYLDKVSQIFDTSSKAAAISQFSKRYGYLSMASGLYAMTMFNKGLDYSVENCHIESIYQDKSWLPEVRLADWEVTRPADGDRFIWRNQVIKTS